MADRLIFIGWDEVTRGREERAVEVFNESVGLYGRLQQEGKIEGFNAVFLPPNGSGLQGYFELHGTADQLHAVRESEEFQRTILDGSMIVENFRVIDGYTNEAIAQQMGMFQDAIAKLPSGVR
jgi:hypothetical protein